MNSSPMASDVPTMKSTTLPMADMMGEFRSSSKGCQDRPLLYDSSPINWNLHVRFLASPRQSPNTFGSALAYSLLYVLSVVHKFLMYVG